MKFFLIFVLCLSVLIDARSKFQLYLMIKNFCLLNRIGQILELTNSLKLRLVNNLILIFVIGCMYRVRCNESIDVHNNDGCSQRCRNDGRGYDGHCGNIFCYCRPPKGMKNLYKKSKTKKFSN